MPETVYSLYRDRNKSFRIRYIIGFILIWTVSAGILHFGFQQPLSDSLPIGLIFGFCFPFITRLMVRHFHPKIAGRPAFNKEGLVISALVLWIVWYISYGTGWINSLVSTNLLASPRANAVYVLLKKGLIFFVIPFIVYRGFGFRLKDFGFSIRRATPGFGRAVLIFIVLSAAIILFQFYFGRGAESFIKGNFSRHQLLTGLPVCFAWYFFEVGLVEEFFFRALLQSRLTVMLKSNTAGILVSGLIFGLVHAPGLYLRGASSEGMREQLPFIFWAAYTITVMSLSGIFLGILWNRTRNIYLLMALHAMLDLLPNIADFIQTWGIK
jgi:membrane protease YdiL (CAAX protease family)